MAELRVLVVDDDPEFLAAVQDGLVGMTAVVAHTPLQALWLLERDRFCAVVCDLVFGDVDGRHVLDAVRDRWPATARILVTGFGARLANADEASPAAQAVVLKPCDIGALNRLLADLPALADA
jgi:DNA-binding NtrC family response regulator